MARKKKENPSNVKSYSFTIDANDPNYNDLVQFLDGVDSGARSFVIRQILNSYVKGQTQPSMFPMMGTNNNQNAPQANQSNQAGQNQNQQQEQQQESNTPNDNIAKEEKKEEEKPKPKKNLPPQLKGLKDQFS